MRTKPWIWIYEFLVHSFADLARYDCPDLFFCVYLSHASAEIPISRDTRIRESKFVPVIALRGQSLAKGREIRS